MRLTSASLGLLLTSRPPPPLARPLLSIDPYRPQRPPLDPMVINAVQELLRGSPAEAVARAAVEGRAADPDHTLTADEERLLTRRVVSVGAALEPLHALLEQVAADTPSIEKYGMGADYGLGDLVDPYVRACRAECMLAVLMLHLERVEVEFIDADRLEVLRDAPSDASVQAVRATLDGGGGAA